MALLRRAIVVLAFIALCAAARAADDAEAVYAKMHAAALAQDLDQMRLYAAEAQRDALAVPDVPRTYRITGKARSRDGNAVELRAAGNGESVGLGYTELFGVIDLVKEKGEWKVARLSWSPQRPGAYPEGYVVVHGAPPQPRSNADAPRLPPPVSVPEPSHIYNPKRPQDEKPDDRGPILKPEPAPCVIKPVMSDKDLRDCGATVPASD